MVDLPLATWLAAAMAFVAVALGTVSVALLLEWSQESRRKKVALRQLREMAAQGVDGGDVGLLRSGRVLDAQWLALFSTRFPHLRDIRLMLEQAGMEWSMQSYLLLVLGWGVGLGLVGLTVTGQWLFALPLAAFGASFPYLWIRGKRKRRLGAFESQLPEAIDLLGRAIRAGHPLSSGLDMVSRESPNPVAAEFRRTFEEQRFGLPLEDSLLAMADRVTLVDVRILVTAILIQRNVGGNLAEILDNIAYTIRERFKIRRQLRVYTAQGRMAGYVLAILPVTVGFIIFLLNPEYMLTLFRDPAGRLSLAVATVMQTAGYLWIRNIVNIDI
ncbi:MAG: type II secretion system F family protein [Chloroflexi bacterium]|nr:type II secretion system F family protein [Chloroflexota bacterium]